MNLNLPIEIAQKYKSASQKARIITETWALENMFCPVCTSNKLCGTKPGTEAVDFVCGECEASFQLKSLNKKIGDKIVDASYDAMIRAIRRNGLPHFLFLSYSSETYFVNDLILIPQFCISESAIEKRKPLAQTAKRAGWIGCNIIISLVPPEGRIQIVSSGRVIPTTQVRFEFKKVKPFADFSVRSRGWSLDVLTAIRTLNKKHFTIGDAYSFESILSRQHPENKHVKDKIRQQLQILRDRNFIEFIGKGNYRVL
jgi:type II restriction enzyme